MLDTRDNLRVVRGGDQRFIQGDFMGRELKVLRHLSQQSLFVQLFRFVCGDRFRFIDVWSKQPYATNSINNCKRTSVAGICLQLTVRRLISVMSWPIPQQTYLFNSLDLCRVSSVLPGPWWVNV
ncbi:hypothetical protein FOIG_01278 [Fusarium odoratissimum NRRL 54006]|uniref:Uncharacterized protein n=1 Tax=Fusarium odoratissimum (strain NRRL 54006) TaxID=1089451 RepID=X0KSS1_FUSO5|nr:uncharacterized protein FOIG_01278 [Fusarium odoratissimum NRRL 54006]EXM11736.1 hypothetical protein FOIG_01278 [Fusarium odoratissimum NRRL 54006]